MMKELVENIESEIADLKKTMNRWDEIGDVSLLKVAQRNIAHAQDWMALLNEILIKKSQTSDPMNRPMQSSVDVVDGTEVIDEQEALELLQPEQVVIEDNSIALNKEDETVLEAMSPDLVGVLEEKTLNTESVEEVADIQESKEKETPSCSINSEVAISQSSSTISIRTTEEQGNTVIQENRAHRSVLSQTYEEKAKAIDRKEDLIKETSILGDHLLKMEKGIYASLSLNDIFRFSREWFDGNSKQLELFLKRIEESTSFENAVELTQSTLPVNEEDDSWDDLTEVIERYFKG